MNREDFEEALPHYLTRPQKEGLLRELENYSSGTEIYLPRELEGLSQGDAWYGFTIYNEASGNLKEIKGIIISNSCDIDPSNSREIPGKVTFASMHKLSKIEQIFTAAVSDPQAVNNKIRSIKEQKVSNFFYLPAQGVLEEDYVVWLSDMHSSLARKFSDSQAKTKIFSLNMTGFYFFLFKLSIHFCRFHEELDRQPAA